RRLVGDDRAVGDGRLEYDVELDQDLAVDRQAQITNVDDTGTLGAARTAGGADVGAGRGRDQRERAGRKVRLCVERVHVVEYSEIAERLSGRAEAQGIAQLVARRGRFGGVYTAGEIRDGLVEEISRYGHRHGVGVLIVRDAGRAGGQSAGVGLAAGNAAVAIEPLDGACDIGERDTILRLGVELGPVTDDQPLIRADPSRGRQHREVELAVGRTAVAQRVAAARVERAFARDRGDAVCRKDLRAQDLGRQIAHAARRALRQQV